MEYLIYTSLWVVYFAVHSVLATFGFKHLMYGAGISERGYRLVYILIAVAGFMGVMMYGAVIEQSPIIEPSGLTKFIGLVLATAGIFIIKAAFRIFSLAGFLGIKNEVSAELKTEGILGYIRHPLYAATILILAGFILFSPKWTSVIFLGVTLMYLVVGIWLEEKKLVKIFGVEYELYRKKVPALIPNRWS